MLLHVRDHAVLAIEPIRDDYHLRTDRTGFSDYLYGWTRMFKPFNCLLQCDVTSIYAVCAALKTNGIGCATIVCEHFDADLDLTLHKGRLDKISYQMETSNESLIKNWGGRPFELAVLPSDVLLPLVRGTAFVKDDLGQLVCGKTIRYSQTSV